MRETGGHETREAEATLTASILLVEDEVGIQVALRGLLRREGHELRVEASGAEAIQALDEQAFDLVLTDLSLPGGVNGLDVVRHAAATRPGTPVVLISAYGSEKTAREAIDAGAWGYVPKPFDNDEVRRVVREALAEIRDHGRSIG